jgi:hypothetical protein
MKCVQFSRNSTHVCMQEAGHTGNHCGPRTDGKPFSICWERSIEDTCLPAPGQLEKYAETLARKTANPPINAINKKGLYKKESRHIRKLNFDA